MNSISLILVLSLFVFYVNADVHCDRCTSPPQWESKYYEHNEKLKFFSKARITYDAVNKRERIIDEIYFNCTKNYYDIIYLHQQQKQYRINLKTRECVVEPITRPWRDISIPEDAKSLGESYIGSGEIPHAGLLVHNWFGKLQTPKNQTVRYMLQFTRHACLPVSAAFITENYGATLMHFSDIKPGIKDPSVFNIPPECIQSDYFY